VWTGPKLVKQCLPIIVKPLCHICNCFLQTGVVPDQLKWAKVFLIFKNGIHEYFQIIEQFPYYQASPKWSKDNNLLYGFYVKHSTLKALQLVNRLSTALDNKELPIGVFMDLSKAFGTVDPNILLTKHQAHGLHWFKVIWST
jgi:hypothetical protein